MDNLCVYEMRRQSLIEPVKAKHPESRSPGVRNETTNSEGGRAGGAKRITSVCEDDKKGAYIYMQGEGYIKNKSISKWIQWKTWKFCDAAILSFGIL